VLKLTLYWSIWRTICHPRAVWRNIVRQIDRNGQVGTLKVVVRKVAMIVRLGPAHVWKTINNVQVTIRGQLQSTEQTKHRSNLYLFLSNTYTQSERRHQNATQSCMKKSYLMDDGELSGFFWTSASSPSAERQCTSVTEMIKWTRCL
jgi:hypothetical protein